MKVLGYYNPLSPFVPPFPRTWLQQNTVHAASTQSDNNFHCGTVFLSFTVLQSWLQNSHTLLGGKAFIIFCELKSSEAEKMQRAEQSRVLVVRESHCSVYVCFHGGHKMGRPEEFPKEE